MGTDCFPASAASLREPRCHLMRTSIEVAGLYSGIHLLLWKLGPLLALCPLALLHICVSQRFSWWPGRPLSSARQTFSHGQLIRAHGGQPRDAPSISALGLCAAPLLASAFLFDLLASEREPQPRQESSRPFPLSWPHSPALSVSFEFPLLLCLLPRHQGKCLFVALSISLGVHL